MNEREYYNLLYKRSKEAKKYQIQLTKTRIELGEGSKVPISQLAR